MMNKKGVSILKTILFILLCVTFVILLIYLFNYINYSNNNKCLNNDRINFIEPTNYNPVNDINSFNVYAFKNSNFAGSNTYTPNVFNYESNSLIYYYGLDSNNNQGIFNISSGYYPKPQLSTTIDNKILLGRDLYSAFTISYIHNSFNSVRSWCIGYNCNIPIESFNFTMYYNFPISSAITPYLYIYSDAGSYKFTNLTFNSTTLTYNFSYTSILSTLPTATKIMRFGFGYAVSNNSNYTYYLPSAGGVSSLYSINNDSNNLYKSYFNSLTDVEKDNLCYLAFSTTSYPISYTEGYNVGYNDAINYTNSQINSLNNTILDLQNQITSLNTTITNQAQVIQYLQNQLNSASNRSFKSLFFDMADTPLRVVSNCLGFEVFGINLFQFFIGVLTTLGCIWLIKKFI